MSSKNKESTQQPQRQVVIIGGVAAGMSCAAKLGREAPETSITVFEQGEHISYGACGLPYYVGDVIEDYQKLIVKTPDDFEDTNITVKTRHQVLAVFPSEKKVLVKNLEAQDNEKDTFHQPYNQLVITTGAAPTLPPFAKGAPGNVFTLRDINDGLLMKNAALQPTVTDVVILGSGYIGMEMVEAFHSLGKKVRVINRSDRLMKTFDPEIRELVRKELEDKNIALSFNQQVEALLADDEGMVRAVKTDQNEYPAQLVVVATGVRPSTEFLEGTGINTLKNGAIVIDEKMRTNLDGIYAAGDCASLWHRQLKQPVHIPLATYANRQGRLLGEILAGKDVSFPGGIGASMVKILDITLSQAGLSETQAKEAKLNYKTSFIKGYSHAGYYPGSTPLYIKYIFDPETQVLLGAQLAGEKGAALRIDALSIAIDQGLTLNQLAYSDFAYTPPYSGAWDPLQIAANVAMP